MGNAGCAIGGMSVWAVLQGLLTPVIAAIATYIAWQQWQANRQKLKLDLYQQRFKVFDAVRDMLGMMYTTVSDDKRLFELLSKTRGTEFLFGAEINDYVEKVWRRASSLSATHKTLNQMLETSAPPEDRKKLAEAERIEVTWAREETLVVADKFKKYLDLSKL
jgi:hypothetical protein